MSQHDIKLNGVGYMLAKDSQGRLLGGACREQVVDPFTAQLARDEPYTRAPFRFGDGAGLHAYDGSGRYEWGNCVDSRSGRLLMTPERSYKAEPEYQRIIISGTSSLVAEELINTGSQHGIGIRFTTPSGTTTIRSIAIMVKRNNAVDYSACGNFNVRICQDAAGPKPGTVLGTVNVGLKSETDPWLPFPDRWRNDDWFWLEITFDSDCVIGASTAYWITVYNNNNKALYWAEDQYYGTIETRSVYNGSAWSNGASDYPMMIKVSYKDGPKQYDSYPRCFQLFRGTDEIERMYCGTNYRVLYYDSAWGSGHWYESKTIGGPVLQLLEYNNKLFAACGPDVDLWYSDGSAAGSTAWTQLTGQQANAFAVHDNLLWKADINSVNASATGLTAGGSPVVVGDPGTPVQAMVSHGGKLYCAKPEGIYEISYPDTYPTSGAPTANLLLDFSTERCPRMWILDWHSGLYFPGLGGVYELKNGVLRNAWEDKVDEGALDPGGFIEEAAPGWRGVKGSPAPYTKPRSWAPLYDHGPVGWTAAHGTTRGILFARSNPHQQTSDIIWYDGRNWFSWRVAGDAANDGGPRTVAEYITAAFVQDGGGGRGWLWYNESFSLVQTEWPTWTNDTADDDTVEYDTLAQATTPWFALPEQSKELLLVKVGMTSVNLFYDVDFRIVELWYRLADQGSFTKLGNFTTSPYQELTFPANTKTRRVQFQLRLFIGGASHIMSPIVEQFDLFYQTLPEVSRTHQLIISCAGDQALRTGGVDERAAGEILADLRALAGVASFAYVDPLAISHTVRLTALTAQYMNLLTGPGPGEVGPEVQAIVNLLEV